MKKILIFKTDRLGDLLNISPIINNLKHNYPSCTITLVCSKYNKSIAEYYHNDVEFIIFNKPLFFFLIRNIKLIFFKKYDFIFQLDGKNHSYFTSILVNAKKKVCIRFIKKKKFLGTKVSIIRPNFFINYFFDETELSYEDYSIEDNINYHYLTLYLKLLKKLNIKILSKNHYLPLTNPKKVSKFSDGYCLIHIDERWDKFPFSVALNLKKKILLLSNSMNIVISSNIGGNKVLKYLINDFYNKTNIEFIKDTNLHSTISLVYNCSSCISSHSGLIVHTAAAFKKKIIDIVSKDIFNELDRWIPYNVDYKRLDINNFIEIDFNI